MKAKNYWDKVPPGSNPFTLPRRVSKGIMSSAEDFAEAAGGPSTVKYIWIYVTEEGLDQSHHRDGGKPALQLEEWLNIVDESAALGAEWMVVYVGASLSQCPEIWELCAWAQSVHDLKVGIHVSNADLSDDEIDRLLHLDTSKTYLMAEEKALASLRFLEEKGIRLCESHLKRENRISPCTDPQAIACVGSDGGLYTCGLVLGNERFSLGHSQERTLKTVMQDGALPHVVHDTKSYPSGGCDACPPRMVKRLLESEKI